MTRRAAKAATRPPMLAAIDAARPYAEQLVFHAGILCNAQASSHDCPDASLQIISEWLDSQLSAKHQRALLAMGDDFGEVVSAAKDAGYVLGIAVGSLLRLPARDGAR